MSDDSNFAVKEPTAWEKFKAKALTQLRTVGGLVGHRVPLLILGIIFMFDFDFSTMKVLGFSLAFLSAQALASHILRKVLFPYFDMEKFLNESLKTPISAAVAVLSVCLVLSVLLYSAAILWVGTARG